MIRARVHRGPKTSTRPWIVRPRPGEKGLQTQRVVLRHVEFVLDLPKWVISQTTEVGNFNAWAEGEEAELPELWEVPERLRYLPFTVPSFTTFQGVWVARAEWALFDLDAKIWGWGLTTVSGHVPCALSEQIQRGSK